MIPLIPHCVVCRVSVLFTTVSIPPVFTHCIPWGVSKAKPGEETPRRQ
ncbi:hypothetical protein KCP76_08370 [Salmonella enterica subsp. enterica serovar Weltevreden]|nr:hypothetical protein KCP76_08370 [Salmonella enterica subsp. enterica serovar Weltevreden]